MSTTATRKSKTPRFCRLVTKTIGENGAHGVIRITEGGKIDHYLFYAIPSDWGTAYEFGKLSVGGETYEVLLSALGDSCTCKGFCRYSHCRHVECLKTLTERKLI